jgi:hypothetical protein
MSDTVQPLMVLRLKDRPGKFTVIVPNPEQCNLSPHYGEFTELEVRRFLANRGQSVPQIEMLMQWATEAPEFYAPQFIVS